jgi:broad specificity phosphatase PhoE
MELPPRDPFNDYLQGLDLLQKLEKKRRQVEEARNRAPQSDVDWEAVDSNVQRGMERTLDLLATCEAEMESVLGAIADRADEGRELFLRISDSFHSLKNEMPENWESQVSETYSALHKIWYSTLTLEERKQFEQS